MLLLDRANDYRVDLEKLAARLRESEIQLAVLVNPNNPTGQFIPKEELMRVIRKAAEDTRFLVDETYVDYVGRGQSLEGEVLKTKNLFVLESMSKAFALSGGRGSCAAGSRLLRGSPCRDAALPGGSCQGTPASTFQSGWASQRQPQ